MLFRSEGLGDRYRWLPELLGKGETELEGAAATARKVWSEPESRNFLLELAVVAHTDDNVRQQLADRVNTVVATRLSGLGETDHCDLGCGRLTPREVTWLLQIPPIGFRLLSSLGVEPTKDEYTAVIARLAQAVGYDAA